MNDLVHCGTDGGALMCIDDCNEGPVQTVHEKCLYGLFIVLLPCIIYLLHLLRS